MYRRGWGCGCGGCLGSVLLTVVVVLALGYFFVFRPIQSFLAGVSAPAQTQTDTSQNAQPTAQKAVTLADVQRFVRVRRAVKTAMGSSFTGVTRVFDGIQKGDTPNLATVLGVLRDAAGSVGTARSAQQKALLAQGMNQTRYTYVRNEVNKALGVPDIDFQKAAQSLQAGKLPDLNTTVLPANETTKKLIAPFQKELTETAPLGLLGL
ncbi:hypothetical protein MF271_16240 [Deinococcus sp. KNUC1210]|uniref:hypothetical protein n=1 Tax=Deinococcus sp. KNUC1210 TaxID=2917691 RepID=UPI001EF00E2E|nr:hypothetical protein [Deinococcus sp. KNUC1210]ULH15448.1 hypothetical protein MF271_16240 [Deinococcus sp. KNUC1210]